MGERIESILKKYSQISNMSFKNVKKEYRELGWKFKHHKINMMEDTIRKYWDKRRSNLVES